MVRRVSIFHDGDEFEDVMYVQTMNDKSLGALMLSTAAAIFSYYTVWTILLVSNVMYAGYSNHG